MMDTYGPIMAEVAEKGMDQTVFPKVAAYLTELLALSPKPVGSKRKHHEVLEEGDTEAEATTRRTAKKTHKSFEVSGST